MIFSNIGIWYYLNYFIKKLKLKSYNLSMSINEFLNHAIKVKISKEKKADLVEKDCDLRVPFTSYKLYEIDGVRK